MASKSLEQQIATIRQSLFTEELILDEQFAKLEELEGEDDPNFAENFANIYLSESTKYIDTIEQTFEAIALDVAKLDECLDSFQRDSACLGANKVIIEITKMLHCCRRGDMEG
ncbi:histidine-containing phosphotransfer protein 4-like [Alnus glutinosa]|uniref:histidine-containing phosphotransfer protein 4-like n=1 Tax=Alnus glutinosa TaxID=3517 RepID=UPI002D79EDF2|nr:histidine-containing phosphotransfer protein 4-like [Alnus glutinosa]